MQKSQPALRDYLKNPREHTFGYVKTGTWALTGNARRAASTFRLSNKANVSLREMTIRHIVGEGTAVPVPKVDCAN